MYEASDIATLGAAHELILGIKLQHSNFDSEGEANRTERQMDIDETDE
jgi:hypothetical protein